MYRSIREILSFKGELAVLNLRGIPVFCYTSTDWLFGSAVYQMLFAAVPIQKAYVCGSDCHTIVCKRRSYGGETPSFKAADPHSVTTSRQGRLRLWPITYSDSTSSLKISATI